MLLLYAAADKCLYLHNTPFYNYTSSLLDVLELLKVLIVSSLVLLFFIVVAMPHSMCDLISQGMQGALTTDCCSVTQSYLNLCDHMDYSTTGFPCPSLSPRVCSNSFPLN